MSDDSDDICRWCLKRKGEHIPHGWHFMCPPHVGSSTKYEPVQQFSKPTQRAPVEQGRDELQELKLSSEGGRSGSSHPVTLLSSPSPASADHAREGALRERLLGEPLGDLSFSERLAEKMCNLLTDKFTNSVKIAAGIIKQELEQALADGKEGGE